MPRRRRSGPQGRETAIALEVYRRHPESLIMRVHPALHLWPPVILHMFSLLKSAVDAPIYGGRSRKSASAAFGADCLRLGDVAPVFFAHYWSSSGQLVAGVNVPFTGGSGKYWVVACTDSAIFLPASSRMISKASSSPEEIPPPVTT